MRRWLRVVSLFVTLTGIAVGIVAVDYWRFLHGPMQPPAEAERILDIERGTSVHAIAAWLAEEGWIERPLYFRLTTRITDDATRIHAGEYRLQAGQSPRRLLRRLVEGDVIEYRLTVIEGWTFAQMRRAVESHEAIDVTLGDVEDGAVPARIDAAIEHPEGWFYPDTYVFTRGTTDRAIYRRAHERMKRVLAEEWENRGDEVPVESAYEALILASIVERETGVAAERARVAGVFAERLDIGMRLQTDPTVAYGLGEDYDGRLSYADLRTDTPYNTYTRHGLPPTPIALPGRPALHAAINPERRGEYYFVATDDGGHVFSKTLEAHNEAVIEHQLDGDASRLRGYTP